MPKTMEQYGQYGINKNGELGDDTITTKLLPISISKERLDVNEKYIAFTNIGETKQLEVKLNKGFNLLKADIQSNNNTFTSLDTNVAQVTDTGLITAIGAGTTYIRIENKDYNLLTTVKIVVADREGITSPKVEGGSNHYVALKADGTVWSWGYNAQGQLGLGDNQKRIEPTYTGMDNVQDVAACYNYTAILKKDGTVWVTGQNNYGQLGQNDKINTNTFVQVKSENGQGYLTDVIQITAGNYFMAALKKDGTVYTWGYNRYGQLGCGNSTDKLLPVKVREVNNIMQITAGGTHLLMLDSDSTVWATGYNYYGQLGDNTRTSRNLPVKVLDSTGNNPIRNIKKVEAGTAHTMLLDMDGNVWSMGYNNYGQLGKNTKTGSYTKENYLPTLVKDVTLSEIKDAKDIFATYATSGIIRKDGTVWTAGYNTYGAAANGTKTENLVYRQMLGENGEGFFTNTLLGALTNNSSLVADENGNVYTSGYNAYGQLGDNTTLSSTTLIGISEVSIEVPGSITMYNVGSTTVIKPSMKLGFNLLYKTLTSENYTFESLNKDIVTVDDKGTVTAVKYGDARIVVTNKETGRSAIVLVRVLREGDIANPKVSSGTHYSAALRADGTVWTWGYNNYGELGLGDNAHRVEPAKVNIDNVVDISAGHHHILYLKADGTVWASGLNNYGQLGQNNKVNSNVPVQINGLEDIIQVSAGSQHSLALAKDGTVWSWGYNAYGQLGDTTSSTRLLPVKVRRLTGVKEIAAGYHISTALDIEGKVYTWGYNAYGQLGHGNTSNLLNATVIENLPKIKTISNGTYYNVFVTETGEVYTCGYNTYGNLGTGNTTNQSVPVKVTLDDGTALSNIDTVDAGYYHVIAKTKDGKAYSWGLGTSYQFGNASAKNILKPTKVIYGAGREEIEDIMCMGAGYTHTVIVKTDGTVWTTGQNNYGQVGDTTKINKKEWVCISNVRIAVDETSVTIPKIGGTYQIKPRVDLGFNLLYESQGGGEFTYSSKNPNIATVDGNGIVTGVKQGKTKIGISDNITHKTIYVDIYVLAEGDVAFPQIDTYQNTTVALKSDGTVWTWGYNGNGELGLGDNKNQSAPCKVNIDNVKQIAVGYTHVLALKTDGTVWSFGLNSSGELGIGSNVASSVPVQVLSEVQDEDGHYIPLGNIKEISAGYHLSMALANDGHIYTWGYGGYGQLGLGSTSTRNVATKMTAIYDITKIEAGQYSGYAINDEGKVYAWGYNRYGQLGDGSNTNRTLPVLVSGLDEVIDIAATRSYQTFALKADGTVWGFGYATNDALTDIGGAIPKALQGVDAGRMRNISDISGGYYAGSSISDEGKVAVWGTNGYGGLGTGDKTNVKVPVYAKETDIKDFSDAFISAMGTNYSIFAKTDGTVWAVGRNNYGQLGNASTTDLTIPENISSDYIHTNKNEVIIKGIGKTEKIAAEYVRGFNLYNDIDGTSLVYASENEDIVTIDQDGNITSKALGKTYITIKSGNIARRIEVNVLTEEEKAVMDIKMGINHTIGLKTNGTIWSFGANNYGQLALGNIKNEAKLEPVQITGMKDTETVKAISSGANHTLVLTESGKVYASGYNNYGQLGNGNTTNRGALEQISGLTNIVKVTAYKNVSYALNDQGEMFAWGQGHTGEPTKISFYARVIDIQGRYILTEYGTVWDMKNLTKKIEGLSNIVEIASSDNHALALDIDGRVYAWGSNTYGECGLADVNSLAKPTVIENIPAIESIKAGIYNSYLLSKDGEVYSFGRNTNHSLGTGTDDAKINTPTKLDLVNIERISVGQNCAAAIAKNGFVYTWGANGSGQLGLENKEETKVPTQVGKVVIVKEEDNIKIEENETHEVKASLNNTFNLRYDVITKEGFKLKAIDEAKVAIKNTEITGTNSGLTTVVIAHDNTEKTANVSVEVLKKGYKSVIDLVSGNDFTLGLRADGTVWGWGLNKYGELANNKTENEKEPIKIEVDTRVKQITAGTNHIMLLTEDGKVLASGENKYGQLGTGGVSNKKVLIEVKDETNKPIENIVRISSNKNTSYLADVDGNVYIFGENANKVAVKLSDIEPICEIFGKYGITRENKVIDLSTKTIIDGLEGIIKIAEGTNHTLFLTKDKKVYAMGQNGSGQCGIGTKVNVMAPASVKNNVGIGELENVVDISAGENYSIAVLENGDVYTWGSNANNVLGTEKQGDQVLPKKNGNTKNIMLVSAGTRHVVVADLDGTVYAWGNGENGSLGNGLDRNSHLPVVVGSEEIIANTNHLNIAKDGTVDVGGRVKLFNLIKDASNEGIYYESNDTNIVTVDESGIARGIAQGTTSICVKKQGTDERCIVQVSVLKENTIIKPSVKTRGSNAVILKADGTVWTYGENKYGELGNGTKTPNDKLSKVEFAENVKMVQVEIGENHVLSLDENGSVWAWGSNGNGELGTNTVLESLTPIKLDLGAKIVKIVAGYNTSYAITEENKLISWGLNTDGQLGVGVTDAKKLPTVVENLKNVLDVAAGKVTTAVVNTNGEVYTSGSNSQGGLTGTDYTRNRFEKAEGLQDIAYIAAGEYHNMALDINGKLFTWGLNSYGQLGTGNQDTISTPVEITGIEGISEISAGKGHSLVVTKAGKIYATGLNNLGTLGTGDRDTRSSFEEINTISDVYSISAGNTYTMAIKRDGTVYAWGDYYHGIVANRTKTNSITPVQVGKERFLLENNELVIQEGKTKKISVQNASNFNVWDDQSTVSNYTYTNINESIALSDNSGVVTGNSVGTTWVKVKETNTNEEQIAVIKVVEQGNTASPRVSGGQDFGVVLKADGSVWSFGQGANGEIGNGSLIGARVPTSINIIKTYTNIESGDNFTIVLRKDGTVWSFGSNTNGELGLGDRGIYKNASEIKGLTDVVKISAGSKHTVVLNKYGEVYVWGYNNKGQLGTGDTKSVDVPTKLDLGGQDIIDVCAGKENTILITSEGRLIVYGEKTGISGAESVRNAVKVQSGDKLLVLTEDGNVQEVGDSVNAIYSAGDAVEIAVKGGNNLILTKTGKVYAYGANTNGELGLGNNSAVTTPTLVPIDKDVIDIGCGINNTYIITKDGLVYGSGKNTYTSIGNENEKDTNTYTLVGKQDFEIKPDNKVLSTNDEMTFEIKAERFNVFRKDERAITDFTWKSSDENIVTVLGDANIKALAEGTAKITVQEKETGFAKEATIVVIPLDANRIEELTVDKVDAKVTEAMKYEVTVASDNETGRLVIKTKDKTDKISIDGGITWYENGVLEEVINLPTKETIVNILVETTNSSQFTYELKVIRQSTNVELESLTVNDELATAVNSTEYISIISGDTANVKVKTEDDAAKIELNGKAQTVGIAEDTIDMTNLLVKVVPIKVTSESGKEIEYTLTIYKDSTIMNLESLQVDGVEATKNSVLEYSIIVPRDKEKVSVKAVAFYELAGVNIQNLGEEIKETTRDIVLTGENTTVKIKLRVEGVEREYTLNIHKKPDGAALALVYVNGKEIIPNGNKYEANISSDTMSAEVLAITSVDTSSVQIGINPSEIGKSKVTVDTTQDTVTYTITVIDAEDAENVQNYQLIIKKPSSNTALNKVTVGNDEISIDATRVPGENTYKVSVNEKYTNLHIKAETEYSLSEVKIADNPYKVHIDEFDISVPQEGSTVKITVQAQDKSTEEYTLIIEKTSSNANIKEITVDGENVALVSGSDNTYEYTMKTANNKPKVHIVMEHEKAEVAIDNILYEVKEITKDITMNTKDVKLVINTKAEDGTEKVYYLNIYGLPDNADLKEITVNGSLAKPIPYTNRYQVKVKDTDTKFDVTAVADDSLAMIGINGNDKTKGTANITLNDKNNVNIDITAQDGKTSSNYVLEILEMSKNTELSFVKIDGSIIAPNEAGEYRVKIASDITNVNAEVETVDENAKVRNNKCWNIKYTFRNFKHK